MEDLLALYNEFNSQRSPFINFFDRIAFGKKKYKSQLLQLIVKANNAKDPMMIEFIVSMLLYDGGDKDFTKVLCELLHESWHHSHEDIITLFQDIKDPDSVKCIYDATFINQAHDEGRSLQKKCIRALGNLNTKEAIEKLKILSCSEDMVIGEEAKLQLAYLEPM